MSEAINKAEVLEGVSFYGDPIKNDQDAEAAIIELKNIEAEREKWTTYYNDLLANFLEECERREVNEKARLQAYFASVPHKVTKTQESYQLPSGKLVFKKQAPDYQRDEAAVLDWARASENYEIIKVKESLDWAGLKKRLKTTENGEVVDAETGEVVPGIKVVDREPVFQVSIN